MATYLQQDHSPAAQAEAHQHRLAGLLYCLAAGLGQHLQNLLRNYAVMSNQAQAAGQVLIIPGVAELLADPAFEPLARWLDSRGVDLDQLQEKVVTVLDRVRQAAFTEHPQEETK